MRKIILQNTSTEEKQEYENTWGKRKKTHIHQKSSLSQIIWGKREEKTKQKTKKLF